MKGVKTLMIIHTVLRCAMIVEGGNGISCDVRVLRV